MNFIQNNQIPFIENCQSSQTFPSMPQNNCFMFRNPLNSSSSPQTSSNDDVETQFSQFSTQIGLENITLMKRGEYSTKKKLRVFFPIEEDTHLVDSWPNVSLDPIVGVGQARDRFWMRVTTNYNKFRGELRE